MTDSRPTNPWLSWGSVTNRRPLGGPRDEEDVSFLGHLPIARGAYSRT